MIQEAVADTTTVSNIETSGMRKFEKTKTVKVSAEELQQRLASGGLDKKTQHVSKIREELGIGVTAKKIWDSIPNFNAKYSTTIFNKKVGVNETSDIEVSHCDGVSTLSFDGIAFGKFVVSAYKKRIPMGNIEVSVLCGPNFVSVPIDPTVRKEKFHGHVNPWLGFKPANIFSQSYYRKLMTMFNNGEFDELASDEKGPLHIIEEKVVTVMPDIDIAE